MKLKTFPLILESAVRITPNVKHFVFRYDGEGDFSYTPGQFITLHFEHQGKMLRRSYSIANKGNEGNRIEFAAGYVEHGPASELLFNLQPGEALNANGPFGRLVLKDEPVKRLILLATSTGVTPYRCMLNEIETRLSNDPTLEVIVLQGVQKREDVLYGDEFIAFSEQHPRFQFCAHLSRENIDKPHPFETSGYVQSAFDTLSLDPEHDLVYLCGNPQMIDDSFNILKERGFEIKSIRREKYISSK